MDFWVLKYQIRLRRLERVHSKKNKLKEVSLPEKLEEIGTLAFNGNELISVDIPDSVVKNGRRSFFFK